MEKDPFKEYLKEAEPDKAGKSYVWSTAIGLQAVDGLKPSKYLIDTAIQNIEGKITMKEAQSLIDSYYGEKPVPDMKSYVMGPHTITKRKLTCPKCGCTKYCKHVLTR